mmetsp:Transcript_69598/g.145397  ORF Transcript_69598/g.145397 Transcript_69598/m.145397 type:complete len:214 (+) Transcript_69598:164-805(+)
MRLRLACGGAPSNAPSGDDLFEGGDVFTDAAPSDPAAVAAVVLAVAAAVVDATPSPPPGNVAAFAAVGAAVAFAWPTPALPPGCLRSYCLKASCSTPTGNSVPFTTTVLPWPMRFRISAMIVCPRLSIKVTIKSTNFSSERDLGFSPPRSSHAGFLSRGAMTQQLQIVFFSYIYEECLFVCLRSLSVCGVGGGRCLNLEAWLVACCLSKEKLN